MSSLKWKHEKTQVTVLVSLRYTSPQQRREAMRDLRKGLGCEIGRAGTDGCFSVKTGRVAECKTNQKVQAKK